MKRWILALIGAIIFGYLIHLFYFEWEAASQHLKDFQVYYIAGQKAVQGLSVYDVEGHWQFKYGPAVAQLFGYSFSALDYTTSRMIYYAFNALLWMIWLAVVVYKMTPRWEEQITLSFLGLLFFGKAILRDCDLGQANSIALILSGISFHFFSKRHRTAPYWGALCLAFGLQFKLYLAIAFPILVAKGKWKEIILSGLFLTFSSFSTLWILWGWDFAISEHYLWFTSLFSSSNALLGGEYNISVLGVLSKWLPWKSINLLLWSFCLGGFLWMTWKNRQMSWKKQYAWMLAGIVLLNPLSWVYWIAFMIPMLSQVYLSTRKTGWNKKALFAVPCWIAWFGLDVHIFLHGVITLANAFLTFVFLKRSTR